MADIKDVKTVIASALTEIGVNGVVDVKVDGEEASLPAEDVKVVVLVKRLDVAAD